MWFLLPRVTHTFPCSSFTISIPWKHKYKRFIPRRNNTCPTKFRKQSMTGFCRGIDYEISIQRYCHTSWMRCLLLTSHPLNFVKLQWQSVSTHSFSWEERREAMPEQVSPLKTKSRDTPDSTSTPPGGVGLSACLWKKFNRLTFPT